MTLTRHVVHETHVHDFVVTDDTEGWDVREEDDSSTVRLVHHDDWHQVERDAWLFDLRATALKESGWIER
jgi:hypothetical protein